MRSPSRKKKNSRYSISRKRIVTISTFCPSASAWVAMYWVAKIAALSREVRTCSAPIPYWARNVVAAGRCRSTKSIGAWRLISPVAIRWYSQSACCATAATRSADGTSTANTTARVAASAASVRRPPNRCFSHRKSG
jgi:hypothetical protein